MNATAKEWGERLRDYNPEGPKPIVTVSKDVFEKGQAHEVWINPQASDSTQSRARVRSAISEETYDVVLIRDYFFPTFPYVWKCNCYAGRHRFDPCSHVIAVALERGKRYDDEHGSIDGARETGSQTDLGVG